MPTGPAPSSPAGPPPSPAGPPPSAPNRGGHYQRSMAGLVGALIVTVLAVGGFVIFREAFRDNKQVPTKAVDHQIWLDRGRSDGRLLMVAPTAVPKGWTVTSASYDASERPVWRMGMLTKDDTFVGMVESLDSLDPLLQKHVQGNAQAIGSKSIGGRDWKAFTAAEGDGALVLTLKSPEGEPETLLVYGDAGADSLRQFAQTLVIPGD